MATVTIAANGSIVVSLSEQETQLASMVYQERGEDVFTEVFNLQFQDTVKQVMNARFARLSANAQITMLTALASV